MSTTYLGGLIDSWADVTGAERELHRLLSEANGMRDDENSADLSKLLESWDRVFPEVTELVSRLTPTHLKLQEHFTLLVFGVPFKDFTAEDSDGFFTELIILRDSYFLDPKPTYLQAYLEASKTCLSKEFYWKNLAKADSQAVVDSAWLRLKDLELELELESYM